MATTDLRRVVDDEYGDEYEESDGEYGVDDREVDNEPAVKHEATGELVQGKLAGRTIYVPPVKQWRASALHALREGDFETWAETTFSDDDFDVWAEVDPTMQEIEDFFATINPGLGTNSGNSRASRRSARRTRKR